MFQLETLRPIDNPILGLNTSPSDEQDGDRLKLQRLGQALRDAGRVGSRIDQSLHRFHRRAVRYTEVDDRSRREELHRADAASVRWHLPRNRRGRDSQNWFTLSDVADIDGSITVALEEPSDEGLEIRARIDHFSAMNRYENFVVALAKFGRKLFE